MTYKLVTRETLGAVIDECLTPVAGLLGFDSETLSLNVDPLGPDLLVSLQMSPADGVAYMIPLRFTGDGAQHNIPIDNAMNAMKRIWDACAARALKLVAANAAFDFDATHRWHQRWWPRDCYRDPLIRAWLSDHTNLAGIGFGLKQRVKFHLGHEMTPFKSLAAPRAEIVEHPLLGLRKRFASLHFDELDPRAAATLTYACEDADYARRLQMAIRLNPQQELIELVELANSENVRRYRVAGLHVDRGRVKALYATLVDRLHEIDERLAEVLAPYAEQGSCHRARAVNVLLHEQYSWMERHGRLKASTKEWRKRVDVLSAKGRTVKGKIVMTDKRFSLDAKRVLMPMLALDQLVGSGKCIRGDVPRMSELAREVVELLIERATTMKDKSTYAPALGACDENGRLRFDVRCFGVDTARFSGGRDGGGRVAWQINCMTLPKRTRVKHCITAPPGSVVVQLDVRSEEPRVCASLSKDAALHELFMHGSGDFHRSNAAHVFGKPIEDVTKSERADAKVIGLATFYNRSAETLAMMYADTCAEPLDHALKIRDRLMVGYGGLARFRDMARLRAAILKENITPFGRAASAKKLTRSGRRRILEDKIADALNAIVQATAADVMRVLLDHALVWIDANEPRAVLYNTIHDSLELRWPVDSLHLLPTMLTALETAITPPGFSVPLLLDLQLGWSMGSRYEWTPGQPLRRTHDPAVELHPSEHLTADPNDPSRVYVACPALEALNARASAQKQALKAGH